MMKTAKLLGSMLIAAMIAGDEAVAVGKHVTNRPTFLLGYLDHRCFKEMFY